MAAVKRNPTAEKARLEKLTKELGKVNAEVGWQASAKYPDGTPVAYVAAIQEYGYEEGNIPSRAFMRPTVENKKQEWSKKTAVLARTATSGEGLITAMGEVIAGDMREAITEITTPELADSTLRNRKTRKVQPNSSEKPLVDTRVLMNTLISITKTEGA